MRRRSRHFNNLLVMCNVTLARDAESCLMPVRGFNSARDSENPRIRESENPRIRESRRFEHDVLRAMIQHVAPHLLQSFPALDDLEKMISGELTDFASEE
jgi:hypothetical protein